jgi:Spy/CpxP family protein refolding chaperone
MKKLFIIIFTTLIFTAAAFAQNDETKPPSDSPKRPNLLATLDLSPEQMQQLRKINKAQKPKTETAQRNLRLAKTALDEAIYADNFTDGDVLAKTKEVQLAQAELVKTKAETEFSIRKVLTPEQLVKFRELRQRLMQANRPQNRPLLKQVNRFQNRQP